MFTGYCMLPSFKVTSACIVPKLIIEAPIQPLTVTAKSLAFLQRNDIPVSSHSWPLVVVNVIQILARKPTLVSEWVPWEVISWCGAISVGALVVRTGLRKAVHIFRPALFCQKQERRLRSIIHLLLVRLEHRGCSSQNGLADASGIICLVLCYMWLMPPFHVLFQGDCLWYFYRPGKCGTRNDHILGNFLWKW